MKNQKKNKKNKKKNNLGGLKFSWVSNLLTLSVT